MLFQLQHWENFFLGIGHPFVDPYEELTVQMLLDLDVRQFARIIDGLFNDAVMKSRADKEYELHTRYWLTREFEFAQHIPDISYKRQHDEHLEIVSRRTTPVILRARSDLEQYHVSRLVTLYTIYACLFIDPRETRE